MPPARSADRLPAAEAEVGDDGVVVRRPEAPARAGGARCVERGALHGHGPRPRGRRREHRRRSGWSSTSRLRSNARIANSTVSHRDRPVRVERRVERSVERERRRAPASTAGPRASTAAHPAARAATHAPRRSRRRCRRGAASSAGVPTAAAAAALERTIRTSRLCAQVPGLDASTRRIGVPAPSRTSAPARGGVEAGDAHDPADGAAVLEERRSRRTRGTPFARGRRTRSRTAAMTSAASALSSRPALGQADERRRRPCAARRRRASSSTRSK